MTTTYVKHPVTGEAAEVARLVLTDKNGTPKEVSALWKDGICLFAKKGAVETNGLVEDIDGNDVMSWSLASDTPTPRHTHPWESEIIPLHDEDRWYVIVPDSVVVTMGGVDITDSCYDSETHKISIPVVKGDIEIEAEATEVIQFEKQMQVLSTITFLGQREENTDEDIVDDGLAHITQIEGNTFVWNQLLEHTGSQVETISTAVYYKRINGVVSVFTSEGETITAETDTDMLINLTHLYGANARNFPLDPTDASTLAQFKALFPLDYYPYSAPRLMNLATTSVTASSNGLSTVFDIDVKNITGKLDGSGNSVNVFPDGMAGVNLADIIFKENGIWKANARCKKTSFDWADGDAETVYATYRRRRFSRLAADEAELSTSSTAAIAGVVCEQLMSSNYGNMSLDRKGYCAVFHTGSAGSNYICIANEDYQENMPTLVFIYSLSNAKPYVLDDAWQTTLNQMFHYGVGHLLSTQTNTSVPTTAPISLGIECNVNGFKIKPICVANWGGNIIEREITSKETAAVESLADVFYENKEIIKFNELKYFTGLTSLYSKLVSSYGAGQFYGCTNLQEVTIPKNINNFNGAFRQCPNLKTLDISPTKATSISCGSMLYISSANASFIYLKLAGVSYNGNLANLVNRRSGLTTIEVDGTADWSDVPTFGSIFYRCTSLTTIQSTIEGFKPIVGISNNISFSDSPLTIKSALAILDGLADNVEDKIVTFNVDMQETYEADTAFVSAMEDATDKGWQVAFA